MTHLDWPAVIHRVFGTDSGYLLEIVYYRESLISIFQKFFVGIIKIFKGRGQGALAHHSGQ